MDFSMRHMDTPEVGGVPRDAFLSWGRRSYRFAMEEHPWSVSSSPIDHQDRSRNSATLTRRERNAPFLERFPTSDAGRVRLQKTAVYQPYTGL
jgi:hypothetical protein